MIIKGGCLWDHVFPFSRQRGWFLGDGGRPLKLHESFGAKRRRLKMTGLTRLMTRPCWDEGARARRPRTAGASPALLKPPALQQNAPAFGRGGWQI